MSHRTTPHRPRGQSVGRLVEAPPVPLDRLAHRVPQLPASLGEEPLQVSEQGLQGACQSLALALVRSSHPACQQLRVHSGLQSGSLAGPSLRCELPRLLLLLHLPQPLPSSLLPRFLPRPPRLHTGPVPRQPRGH
eukprot:1995561-Heterocapsa_arctica.AAC.1